MKITIPNGVWPTMLTPFTENNEVDYIALDEMIEWYISHGVAGLFAVCQSSEMFFLSFEERIAIVEYVKKTVNKRVPIIASGHISDSLEDQIKEVNAIANAGADAVVLVSNRLAGIDESDEVWKNNLTELIKHVPEDVPLGFYECPYPYKRLFSPSLLKWCGETERFLFLKDTSCNPEHILAKLNSVKSTSLKIYNANSATLLQSLKDGVAGFSGIMTNFHPDLYVWLVENWDKHPDKAEKLISFLGLSSLIELQLYPKCAKYALSLEGLPITTKSRVRPEEELNLAQRLVVEQLYDMTNMWREILEIKTNNLK